MRAISSPSVVVEKSVSYTHRSKGLILAGITALCWSVLAIGLKQALLFTSSGNIVALRMLISFILLLIYFGIYKHNEIKKLKSDFPLTALIAGVLLAFNYYGFMKGVEYTGAGNAQIMIQLGPTLLMISGLFLFKESFNYKQIIGILIAVIGFSLFYYDQQNFDTAATLDMGNLWLILAAVTWAVYAILQKQLIPKWDPQTINLVIYFSCAGSLFFLFDFKDSMDFNFYQWLLILFLGLNTVVAYGCFAESLKYAPASEVSLIITVNPLGTLAILWLGQFLALSWIPIEYLTWIGVLGALCVVFGVGWTLIRKKS